MKYINDFLASEECEYFSISFFFQCLVILLLSFIVSKIENKEKSLVITSSQIVEETFSVDMPIEIPENIVFDEEKTSLSENIAELQSEDSSLKIENIETPSNLEVELKDFNPISEFQSSLIGEQLSGISSSLGAGLSNQSSTGGALDRLTLEIIDNAAKRKLTVAWLLDASVSLNQQRQQIHNRFDKIIQELEYATEVEPIVHTICSFGKTVNFITQEPSSDSEILKKDISNIVLDESGIENTFDAVGQVCKKYAKSGSRLMIIIFTDEVGDDISISDAVANFARSKNTVVYVVGSPAPFGKSKTQFKFVDFDPNYDQQEKWVEIQQGPETLQDMILDIKSLPIDEETLDSGFGPFALSKLCMDTGGLFFSVHPNRSSSKIQKKDVSPLSSHISRFFDHSVMRDYVPDYRSVGAQNKEDQANITKQSLIKACSIPLHITGKQTLRFKAFSEGEFVNELNMAQRFSAKLEPQINEIYNTLLVGEPMHQNLKDKRWLASYCLAMGRITATKCRIESYNMILAEAKTGLKKKDNKSNIWELSPSKEFKFSNSTIKKNYESSQKYLKFVAEKFPDTPWALIANEELNTPMGYSWSESYEEPRKTTGGGINNNNNPKDDMVKKIQPKPQRKIDKI